MPRSPKPLSYDPQMVDFGEMSKYFVTYDEYFREEEDTEDTLSLYISRIMDELPERQRSCIEMCIFNNHSYLEASRVLGCSDQTARRETLRALAYLKEQILQSRWAYSFDSRLPDEAGVSGSSSFFEILSALGEDNE